MRSTLLVAELEPSQTGHVENLRAIEHPPAILVSGPRPGRAGQRRVADGSETRSTGRSGPGCQPSSSRIE